MSERSSARVASSSGVTAAASMASRTAGLDDSAPWLPMRTIGSSSPISVRVRNVARSRPDTTATWTPGRPASERSVSMAPGTGVAFIGSASKGASTPS